MAVRSGMEDLVDELRLLTETQDTTDEAAIDYGIWTDDALQTVLDVYGRRELVDVELQPLPQVTGTVALYAIPFSDKVWLERDDTICTVVNTSGQDVGAVTNYAQNTVTHSSTLGEPVYVRGRAFDLWAAAANIWAKKASMRSSMIQAKAGDHTLYEQQEYEHCLERYRFYAGQKLRTVVVRRAGYA